MRTALLLLLAFAATTSLANTQTVWKWVDDKGVTHYSDRPVPGATKLELSVGTHTGSGATSVPAPSNNFGTPQSAAPAGPTYQNFELWKPANEESIVNTGGAVTINIRVDPALRDGHTLRLLVDGRLIDGSTPNATTYELTNVPRGTHVAFAQIFDEGGERIQETQHVTFFVRQESVANPPVGPALRPPPKPQPRGAANKLPTTQPSYAALNGAPAIIDPQTNKPVVPPPPKSNSPKQGN